MKYKLLYYYIFLLVVFSHEILFAQGEWNNWYFGAKAGVTFQNGTPPTVLMNSSMYVSTISNVISDSSGQLLLASLIL